MRRASASMMTDSIRGKTVEEAEELFSGFRQLITRQPGEVVDTEALGDLEVLGGVAAFPARIKCATLSWHTLKAALNGKVEAATTE